MRHLILSASAAALLIVTGAAHANHGAVVRRLDPSVRDFVRKRRAKRRDSQVRARQMLDDFGRQIDEQNADLCRWTSVCLPPMSGR